MRLWGNNTRREFERQVKPLLKPLYHAALRLTRQVEWAEDLTQDTLVRAYERYDMFTQGTNFRAWLFTILTHTYLNHCERARRRPTTASFDSVNEDGDTWEFPDTDLANNPLTALMTAVLEERLQAALDRLPDEFRLAVILVDMEELSYQEAAEALQIPIGTVRSRVSRGRMHLRKHLNVPSHASQQGA